jgi:phosphorylase/glycogen(starch) synthase
MERHLRQHQHHNLSGTTLFEVSWEVCNKVGGIYAVVSSKVLEVVEHFGDNYYLLGPDIGNNQGFIETDEPCWNVIKPPIEAIGMQCRFGRWNIPGNPKVILVKFKDRYNEGQILYELWNGYGVDSLSGGWDYVEPVLFSTACGEAIATICQELKKHSKKPKFLAQFHEWMCGAGIFNLRKLAPEVGTVFTTHATVLGRAMAGSGFDIYRQMSKINPKTEAGAYNVTAKSSLESVCAINADSFTTVGRITADESALFLGRYPDVLTLNGLDMRIISDYSANRTNPNIFRGQILEKASSLLRHQLPTDTKVFITSGRYEYHNKGVDILLDVLGSIKSVLSQSNTTILMLLTVMGGHNGVNHDAISGDPSKKSDQGENWISSHYIYNQPQDSILNACRKLGLNNAEDTKVKVIFLPALLDGNDGFLNMTYYDILSACDLGVFPSWYEPWGYTPQEAIAHSVPTITTDLSGFGIWVREVDAEKKGVSILSRRNTQYEKTKEELQSVLLEYAKMSPEELLERRRIVRALAGECSWEYFFPNYLQAYVLAASKADERIAFDAESTSDSGSIRLTGSINNDSPTLRLFTAVAPLPPAISRVGELAYNFWWAWNPLCTELFSDLNPQIWEKSEHNPVATMKSASTQRLHSLEEDVVFLRLYNSVLDGFDKYMKTPLKTFGRVTPERPIAYFSTEYGLNECLQIYSGGLGVLSGDHLKSASDLCVPLVGVGLLYKNGYFHQQIDKDGRQVAVYPENDFNNLPVTMVKDEEGDPLRVDVKLPGRTLFAQIWVVNVGRINLYLMDTDIPENTPDDRRITARLYEADRDMRIRQEILLGIGGVRMLNKLGVTPACFHMNEGHSAFLIIERIRHLVQENGLTFQEAGEIVRGSNLFTTHTPIDAGNEVFSVERMHDYFTPYAHNMGISWSDFVNMGQFAGTERSNIFEMTVLALKYSFKANGVSELHGYVARNMWKNGWKKLPAIEVPIGFVTNGVHMPSYVGYSMQMLLQRELSESWIYEKPESSIWERIDQIPNSQVWSSKQLQKAALVARIRESIPALFKKLSVPYDLQKQAQAHLNPNALIIGFARRFAPYKRANLLFADIERFSKIVNDEAHPVIFVFAGKAHPADTQGADIMQSVINYMRDPRFIGKVFFIEDYDLEVSRSLVQGCDVWLNTPRRPYEASGTSGQKVPVNGGLNLSISDGWWCEGYNGKNGWTIGPVARGEILLDQNDYNDASSLYTLLEDSVIPTFYGRSSDNLPHNWIEFMKNSMKTLVGMYSSNRMVSDYVHDYYQPAAKRYIDLLEDDMSLAKHISAWKASVAGRFSSVKINEIIIDGLDNNQMKINEPITIKVYLTAGEMMPEELLVQFVVGPGSDKEYTAKPDIVDMKRTGVNRNTLIYKAKYTVSKEGKQLYGVRVFPIIKGLASPLDTQLVLWG